MELVEEVEVCRLLTGEQAADLLDIAHRRDFPHVVSAGWPSPSPDVHFMRVGRVREVAVQLYRASDTEQIIPDGV